MKYLAILKDSFRESVDSKILYVTLALSFLVALVTASLSFRQVTAQEQVEGLAKVMNFVARLQATEEEFSVADFKQVNDAPQPWEGDYRFVWVVRLPKEKISEPGKAEHGRERMPADIKKKHHEDVTSDSLTRLLMEGMNTRFDKIEIGKRVEVPLKDDAEFAKEFRFPVSTQGTKIKDRRGWRFEPALFFGALPLSIFQASLGGIVEFITDYLIGTFGAGITMLLSTIITAFFIPNMLRKGAIDLLLAKPIHRATLLSYKFIGGLTFMVLNTSAIMVSIWFVLGLRTGLWVNGLLLCVFIFTFQFAIFYSVSMLMAVWTRSAIVAILVAVATWGLCFGIGWGYRFVDTYRPEKNVAQLEGQAAPDQSQRQQQFRLPSWLVTTADIVHFVTPHYKDLDVLVTRMLRRDLLDPGSRQLDEIEKSVSSINWFESIAVNVAFIALMVGLSCWWFATRDY